MSLSSPSSTVRTAVFAIVGLLLIGAGIAVGVSGFRHAELDDVVAATTAVPTPAPPPAATAGSPAFDIVRVAPDGSSVLAGRAEPGATVTVQESGHTLGQAQADRSGSWVMTPDTKLQPGAGQLDLSAQSGTGPAKTADAPVLVVVPTPTQPSAPAPTIAPAQTSAPTLALLVPSAAPSRVLQAPAGSGQKLGLDTLDYDEHGAIRFSGSAPANAPVRLYVDNVPVGDAKAGAEGHWAMLPPGEVKPGVHALRLDQLTPEGQVVARVELPFLRETLALSQVTNGQVVVQPGQNLWRLARRAYGAGIRYTVIFMANRDQIRDARLIYPGQVFAMPDPAAQPVATAVVTH